MPLSNFLYKALQIALHHPHLLEQPSVVHEAETPGARLNYIKMDTKGNMATTFLGRVYPTIQDAKKA